MPSVLVIVGNSQELVPGPRVSSLQSKENVKWSQYPPTATIATPFVFRFNVSDPNTHSVVFRVLDTDDDGRTQRSLGEATVWLQQLSNGLILSSWFGLASGNGEVLATLVPPTAKSSPFVSTSPQIPQTNNVRSGAPIKRTETALFDAKEQHRIFEQRELLSLRADQVKRDIPRLAKGGFGEVYTGWVEGIPFKIVIKDQEVQNEQSVAEWRKEISLMRHLRSAHVAEVFGYSSSSGPEGNTTLTIIMEYFPFGDLFGVLHKRAEKHPLSFVQRMRMARHCALGFSVLHGQSIMHRDVKSMNILVSEDYSCKITDFGCSKLLGNQPSLMTMGTGTLLWMAPEVKFGHVYSYSADIYSLGIVLYEIFERKLPDFDPVRGVSLPSQFRSAPIVLPCIHSQPELRLTISQLLKALDDIIRNVLTAVVAQLPASVQSEIALLAAQERGEQEFERFLVSAYTKYHPLI